MLENSHSPKSRWVTTVGWLSIICVLLLTYNNCGQQDYKANQQPSRVEKIEEEVAKVYGASMSSATCTDAQKYICVHRIFSEDVDNYEVELDFPCSSVNGSELCVSGRQYGFNSKVAKEKCGANCTESYEYEEFSCYLDFIASNGTYPIFGAGSTFEEALSSANASCSKFITSLGK